jgi:hypothetical protein
MPSLIADFQEAVRTKNAGLNADLVADDVRLYGMLWEPIVGKATVLSVLNMMLKLIDDLEFVAEYEGADGVVLHIRGRVDGRPFDGVQLVRFNDEILIDEIRNLVRPHSAGAALVDVATEYLSRKLQDPDSQGT